MSSPLKIRKRISFTPIMLTSKSMKPVQRTDYEAQRNQRKYSHIQNNHQELTKYFLREERTTATQRVQAPNPTPQQSQEEEQDRFQSFMRRMTTPTVVRVEFNRQGRRSRKQNEEQQQPLDPPPCELMEEGMRSFYYANAKTFEQFSKMNKVRQSRRLSQMSKEQVDEEWQKYLDKYYLSIKKVKPLTKGDTMPGTLKIKAYPETPEPPPMPEINQPITRFHSNTRIRSMQKRLPKGLQQQQPLQDIVSNTLYKQIQKDILCRKTSPRKDFFVFGMSDNTGKIPQAGIKVKLDLYRDFLFKINYTNSIYVKQRDVQDRPLKAFVGFGNNAALIKGILRRRFWWQIVDKPEDANFVWAQLKKSDIIKAQHRSLCKFRVRRGIHHSAKDIEILERAEATDGARTIMTGQDLALWEHYAFHNGKFEQKGLESSWVRRVGGLLKKKGVTIIESSSKLRVHNHFQANYFLGNKKALFYSLKKYYELRGKDPFVHIPLTFHITIGLNDPQFDRFVNEFARQAQKRKVDRQFRNVWIMKPGELTNCGRGITVCSTLDEIKNRLRSKENNSNGTARTYIIQKYIERPLLYCRRKFDLRHYMIVTCVGGKMKAYWYSEGYVRTSSSQYNISNTKDQMTHLTNDAIQKHGQNYGRYEKGNKLSYEQLQKYLNQQYPGRVDIQESVLPQMRELGADCIRATYALLDPDRKEHNFQLFGLDYMLDQDLKVNLIEVNTNPALDTSCPLLTKILTPLIENTFKICLDPLFPPPAEWPPSKRYPFGDNPLEDNKFTIIFDEGQEGADLKELYQNTSRIDQRMGDVFEEEQEYQDEEKEWSEEDDPKK